MRQGSSRVAACRSPITILAGVSALALPGAAHASLFQGETLDMVADYISWAVLVIAPIIGIAVFWMVHILPEKVAEKKRHPQAKAIQTLCLLSLVFGGLLWPLAWLWAFTKPVLYKLAYGRDKHDDFYDEGLEQQTGSAQAPLSVAAVHNELAQLRRDMDELERRGELPKTLQGLRERLSDLERRAAPDPKAGEHG